MRLSILILILFLCSPRLAGQIVLSPDKWQEDLKFLQKTVHEDYPFLFDKITAQEFDKKVETLYRQIPTLASHQIVVGLARLVSAFQYGHTAIWLNGWDSDNRYGFHQIPINLYQFSDGIYIQGVHQQYANSLGAKVLKVEGVPIEEALKSIYPVVPAENEQFFKAHGLNYLGMPEVLHAQGITDKLNKSIKFTLEKGESVFEQTFQPLTVQEHPFTYGLIQQSGVWLDAREQQQVPLWLKDLQKIYYFEYLPEHQAVYIRHSQIQDDPLESIPDFYNRVFEFIENNEVERLILDVRLNGGGNNYKNKPIVTGLIKNTKINRPGRLFVILGRRTFSACQNLVNELHNYTEAIFVGEPTAENINFFGDNRLVELPNSKIPVRLSFAWWQDKPPWENGPWLAPQLAVDMSFKDYQTNHDPVLDAIWEYHADSGVVDPMKYLEQLYLSGKVDKIQSEAQRLINDPRYRYFPFEDQFNREGYRMLGNQEYEPAIFVFTMNTELFPESANTWDSLAEAYWKSGHLEQARVHYKKAMGLDPEGSVGENARSMLKQIENE